MKPSKDVKLNIRSDSEDPRATILSNLAKTPFTIDRYVFSSVESALQGIKFSDPEIQQAVFAMDGKSALKAGREITLSIDESRPSYVYWQGKEIQYNSAEHRMLIAMFIKEKIRQNPKVQEALLATEGEFIYHDVGVEHPNTSLPEKLYIEILLAERRVLKKLQEISYGKFSMKRIFIIHGWGGSPENDWLPWLKIELEKLGYQVFAPEMPDTDVPVIENWVQHLTDVVGKPDKDTYFIGHSIGCQTILRYLETIDTVIGGAIFVAGWFDLENLENDEKDIAKSWLTTPINLAKIKQILPKSVLVISDNDPYGAFSKNKEKFSELGAKVVTLHNGGHITQIELPIVLEELEKLII